MVSRRAGTLLSQRRPADQLISPDDLITENVGEPQLAKVHERQWFIGSQSSNENHRLSILVRGPPGAGADGTVSVTKMDDMRRRSKTRGTGRGVFLILVGAALFAERLDWIRFGLDWLLPVMLVAFGAGMVYNAQRHKDG